jgi:hypothetical protein
MFQIRRVASRDNPADDEGFERRKAAYQAFVEKRTVDLGNDRADDGVFQKKKSCVPGFFRKTGGPPEKLPLL